MPRTALDEYPLSDIGEQVKDMIDRKNILIKNTFLSQAVNTESLTFAGFPLLAANRIE